MVSNGKHGNYSVAMAGAKQLVRQKPYKMAKNGTPSKRISRNWVSPYTYSNEVLVAPVSGILMRRCGGAFLGYRSHSKGGFEILEKAAA